MCVECFDRTMFVCIAPQREVEIRDSHTNDKQRSIDRHFKLDDARTKLKSFYPEIKTG